MPVDEDRGRVALVLVKGNLVGKIAIEKVVDAEDRLENESVARR